MARKDTLSQVASVAAIVAGSIGAYVNYQKQDWVNTSMGVALASIGVSLATKSF